MKSHILAALHEQLQRCENLLNGMEEAQITAPLPQSHWSTKDDVAHLMAWQLRTIARFEAALQDREPVFPRWSPDDDPEKEDDTEQTNAWIYEHYRDQPWAKVHQDWRSGFQRLLEMAELVSERDLLDTSRYNWLNDYALAYVLVATYDHHQEHYEKWISSLPTPD